MGGIAGVGNCQVKEGHQTNRPRCPRLDHGRCCTCSGQSELKLNSGLCSGRCALGFNRQPDTFWRPGFGKSGHHWSMHLPHEPHSQVEPHRTRFDLAACFELTVPAASWRNRTSRMLRVLAQVLLSIRAGVAVRRHAHQPPHRQLTDPQPGRPNCLETAPKPLDGILLTSVIDDVAADCPAAHPHAWGEVIPPPARGRATNPGLAVQGSGTGLSLSVRR